MSVKLYFLHEIPVGSVALLVSEAALLVTIQIKEKSDLSNLQLIPSAISLFGVEEDAIRQSLCCGMRALWEDLLCPPAVGWGRLTAPCLLLIFFSLSAQTDCMHW